MTPFIAFNAETAIKIDLIILIYLTKLRTRWNCVHWHILSLCSPAWCLCSLHNVAASTCCIVCQHGSWFFYALLAVLHMHCSVMIVYHEVGLVQALFVQCLRQASKLWLSQYELFLVAQQLWNKCFFFLNQFIFFPFVGVTGALECKAGLQSVPAFPEVSSLLGLGSHLYPQVCPGPLSIMAMQLLICERNSTILNNEIIWSPYCIPLLGNRFNHPSLSIKFWRITKSSSPWIILPIS